MERIADWWDKGYPFHPDVPEVGDIFLGIFAFVCFLGFIDLVLTWLRIWRNNLRKAIMSDQERLIVANAIETALGDLVTNGDLSKKAYRRWTADIRRALKVLKNDMSYRPNRLHPLYIEWLKKQIVKRLGDKEKAKLPDRGVKYETHPEKLTLADRLVKKS